MAGNVEISMTNDGWGGDFIIDATGDLVLAQDVPNSPIATQQRVYRLLMTNPRGFNQDTNAPSSPPNDLFAPSYGAGLRLATGEMMTAQLLGKIESSIYAGLQTDPTIVANPPPSVTIQNMGSNVLQVNVSATAVNGEIVTIPSFPLALNGGIG